MIRFYTDKDRLDLIHLGSQKTWKNLTNFILSFKIVIDLRLRDRNRNQSSLTLAFFFWADMVNLNNQDQSHVSQ